MSMRTEGSGKVNEFFGILVGAYADENPSPLNLRGCWLGSFSPITESIYAQGLHSLTTGAQLQVSWVKRAALIKVHLRAYSKTILLTC